MSAPRRWLEDQASTTPLERELLESGLEAEPPAHAQAAVWAAVLTKLPIAGGAASGGAAAGGAAAPAGGAASAGGVGAAGAASAGLLKSVLIGVGSAVAVIATYTAVAPSAPEKPAPPPAVMEAPPASQVRAAPPAPRPAPEPAATVAPTSEPSAARRPSEAPPASAAREPRAVDPVASASSEAAARESRLREESQLVGEARDALRRGDSAGALGQLDQMRAKFPGGMLAQEREALAIEALYRSGRKADAATRAAAFLAAYPGSPHAARVQAFVK